MLLLRVSTWRSDKRRRSRSPLSRLPHSGLDDEANIRRPTQKYLADVTANVCFLDKHSASFRKTEQVPSRLPLFRSLLRPLARQYSSYPCGCTQLICLVNPA